MKPDEIRAKALECAVRLLTGSARVGANGDTSPTVLEIAQSFEDYIRDGGTGPIRRVVWSEEK